MRGKNAVDVLEACYRVDLEERAWLVELGEVAAAALGSPLGALVYLDDGGDQGGRMAYSRQFDPAWTRQFLAAYHLRSVGGITRGLAPLLAGRCTPVSLLPSLAGLMPFLSHFGGARDLFTLNGFDPSGRGLSIGIPLPRRMVKSKARDRVFSRVTSHLAAAYRLRRRLAAPPEAVLEARGPGFEGQGEALEARTALQAAATALEQARSRRVRGDTERATALWKTLVSARWSLIDDFSRDGRRYLVARRNELELPVDAGSLTSRELQVLALAEAGRTNKEIAYELGLADSTVRVLILRAAGKLHAHGRAQTVARFRTLKHG